MNRFLLLAFTLLITQPALARDTGYAMECMADAASPKMLVSFLENGVNKRVRYVKNASGEMWDDHEWLADRFFVRSFRQSKDAAAPILVSSLEIERSEIEPGSLSAVFVQDDATSTNLQCRRWSPQMRNK